MKVFAIIAEFNPFHNGHKYLIETIKNNYNDALCIALMSGSFTQRGDTAIFDKWQRASLSVLGGADLVLELPAAFAVRSAEGFAQGAISLLCRLGCIDMLCFGSETADIDTLKKAAHLLTHQLDAEKLRESLRKGMPYAAAVEETIAEYMPQINFSLKAPNTILAIEYLKAMEKKQANFSAIAIKRKNTDHDSSVFTGSFSSASSIRKILKSDSTALQKIQCSIPDSCYFYMQSILKNTNNISFTENLARSIMAKIRTTSADRLRQFSGIGSGIEYRILKAACTADSIDTMLSMIKSKHLHYSRLQRSLLHILMDLDKTSLTESDMSGAAYARVLAFNANGRKILKKIKTDSSIPPILKTTKLFSQKQFWQRSDDKMQRLLHYDILATDLHALSFNKVTPAGKDFYLSPVYIDTDNMNSL